MPYSSPLWEILSSREKRRSSNRTPIRVFSRTKEGHSLPDECVSPVSLEWARGWPLSGRRRDSGHECVRRICIDLDLPAAKFRGPDGSLSSLIGWRVQGADESGHDGPARGARYVGKQAERVFRGGQGVFVADIFGAGITACRRPDQEFGRINKRAGISGARRNAVSRL